MTKKEIVLAFGMDEPKNVRFVPGGMAGIALGRKHCPEDLNHWLVKVNDQNSICRLSFLCDGLTPLRQTMLVSLRQSSSERLPHYA